METSNEELQSTNEEMQSTNEELQSVNEELETSKEELQSVNEELVDRQRRAAAAGSRPVAGQQRHEQPARGHRRWHHLRGQPPAHPALHACDYRTIINLIQSDVGRPIGHIVSNLVGLRQTSSSDVQSVLDTLETRQEEVLTRDGRMVPAADSTVPHNRERDRWRGHHLHRGHRAEDGTAGRNRCAGRIARRLAVVVSDANDAILVYALDGTIQAWNARRRRSYGWTESEALSMSIRGHDPGDVARAVARTWPTAGAVRDSRTISHTATDQGRQTARCRALGYGTR